MSPSLRFRSLHIVSTALILFLAATPATARAQPGERPDFTVTAEERQAVIDGAIVKLRENYVLPERVPAMEAALRERQARGEYDALSSARAFAAKLTDDLQAVSRDRHLRVLYDARGVPDRQGRRSTPSVEDIERARQWLGKVNYGFEKAERLPGNLGYVEIRGFVPVRVGAETAAAALSFVAHTDALIIDLRRNTGGEPGMIAYVLSYLFDEPTHVNDIYDRPRDSTQQWWTLAHVPGLRYGGTRPVYVLTSRQTFSGGEEFAYDLKVLERATLVGETTGGGAHPVEPHKVSEHFAIGVPFARAINPVTGTNWEGTGVAPDVAVSADEAFDTAVRLALERALEKATDPQTRAEIEKLLAGPAPKRP